MRNKEFFLVGFFPFVWFLGLSIFYYQFLVIFFAVFLFKNKVKIPVFLVPLILYVFFYIISILINFSTSDFERVIASVNNLSFWIFGVILSVFICSEEGFNLERLSKNSKFVLVFIFLFSIQNFLFSNEPLSINSVVAYGVNPDSFPQLVTDSLRLKIFAFDWFDGEGGTRNSVLSPYSTATAASAIILFTFVSLDYKTLSKEYLFWFLITSVCVLSTYSRLLLFVLFVVFFLNYLFDIKKGGVKISVLFVLFLSFPFVFSLLPFIWYEVNELRSGSSSIRFEVYRATFELAYEYSPIIGLAIKDRSDFFIPLGSHSTYLGAFLKVGFLGVFCLFIYSFMLLKRCVLFYFISGRTREGRFLATLVAFTIFMAFEDLDAAQFVSFLYFTLLGFYFYSRRNL